MQRPKTRLRAVVKRIEDEAWSSHDRRERFTLRRIADYLRKEFVDVFWDRPTRKEADRNREHDQRKKASR